MTLFGFNSWLSKDVITLLQATSDTNFYYYFVIEIVSALISVWVNINVNLLITNYTDEFHILVVNIRRHFCLFSTNLNFNNSIFSFLDKIYDFINSYQVTSYTTFSFSFV